MPYRSTMCQRKDCVDKSRHIKASIIVQGVVVATNKTIRRRESTGRIRRQASIRQTGRQTERMRETAAAECNCRALEPASRRRRERMTMHALMPIRLGPPARADRSPLDHGRHRPRPNATTIDSPLSGARAAASILRAR